MDTVTLLFAWESLEPDPLPYKPYKPTLRPVAPVAIQLDVPKQYVLSVTKGKKPVVVLSPAGLAWCLEKLSQPIIERKTGGSK